MAWVYLGQYRWTNSSPAIYGKFYYDKYRNGNIQYYKMRVEISPVTGSSYYGYAINGGFYIDNVFKKGVLIKNASPSQWSSSLIWETNYYGITKTIGTTTIQINLQSNNRNQAFPFTVPIDPAGSIFQTIPDFTYDTTEGVGNPFLVPITKYSASFYDVLTIKNGSTTIAKIEDYISGNVTLDATQITTAYNSMTTVNSATWDFELKTYSDNTKTTQIGSTATGTATASISTTGSAPTFNLSNISSIDSNITSYNITGNNQKYISGISNLKISISAKATANKGATIGENAYAFLVEGKTTQYGGQSDTLPIIKTFNAISNKQFTVTITDSRGNSTYHNITLDLIPYSSPVTTQATLTRVNPDLSGKTAHFQFNGTYTNWSGLSESNSITLAQYRFKIQGAEEYGEYVDITDSITQGNGSFLFDSDISGSFDKTKKYEFQLIVRDIFGEATQASKTALLPDAQPTIDIDVENRRVAIGKIISSQEEGTLELETPLYVESGGTGKASFTKGSYLVGNGTNPIKEKTPEQVASEISGIIMDLLWTNASPTSAFKEQTISLTLTDYTFLIISCFRYNGDMLTTNFLWKTSSYTAGIFGVYFGTSYSREYIGKRSCSISDEGIEFGEGNSQTTKDTVTTNNLFAIPYKIWGVKL